MIFDDVYECVYMVLMDMYTLNKLRMPNGGLHVCDYVIW